MRDQFVKTLTSIAETNENVMLLTGDLGFGVLDHFATHLPDQFLNVGVAEQNMTGMAAGLALEGKIIFTYSIANFPTLRCIEQIRNDVCYHGANVNVVAVGGGFSYGALGMSHHATEDIAMLRTLPLDVIVPCDLHEVEEATKVIAAKSGPSYLRIDKSLADTSDCLDSQFQLGKARVLKEGGDCCLIAAGGIVQEALDAAKAMSEEGINCTVISMHTLSDIDYEMIERICRNGMGIITIEEHNVVGGLGGAIAEICFERGLRPDFFYRVGIRDGLSSVVGAQHYLRKYYHIDSSTICDKIRFYLNVLDRKAM